MAVGLSATHADALLALYDTCFVQVHTADPGAAGTTGVLGSTARKATGFGAASTNSTVRQRANTALIRWEEADVGASGTATHVSLWTASSGGTFLRSIALDAAKTITAGEPFEIAAGDLVVNFGPLAG